MISGKDYQIKNLSPSNFADLEYSERKDITELFKTKGKSIA